METFAALADLPDLTHPPTVALLRTWNAKDASFLPLLRTIRISAIEPTNIVLVRAGLAKDYEPEKAQTTGGDGMDVDGQEKKHPLEKGMVGRLWRGPHVDITA